MGSMQDDLVAHIHVNVHVILMFYDEYVEQHCQVSKNHNADTC